MKVTGMALFDLFRRKRISTVPQNGVDQPRSGVPEASVTEVDDLRGDVVRLYDHGLDPIHTIQAMLYERDRNLVTDPKKATGIWLGINDLLDREDLSSSLRSELMKVRDVLGETIAETGDQAKTFVVNYRENTRRINEMKVLQSYKSGLTDEAGEMQLAAVKHMIAELEYERANNPASKAQDISEEKMADLYRLVEHWDDPSKLEE